MVINTTQLWCETVLMADTSGKQLSLNSEISDAIVDLTTVISKRFGEVTDCIVNSRRSTRFDERSRDEKQAHMIGL